MRSLGEWLRRVGRTLMTPDASLLAKLLGAFIAVLALASLVTLLLETRITRDQLQTQAYQTAAQQGRALDLRIDVREESAEHRGAVRDRSRAAVHTATPGRHAEGGDAQAVPRGSA